MASAPSIGIWTIYDEVNFNLTNDTVLGTPIYGSVTGDVINVMSDLIRDGRLREIAFN